MPDTNDNDIDALLGYTQGIWPEKHAALAALDAMRKGESDGK